MAQTIKISFYDNGTMKRLANYPKQVAFAMVKGLNDIGTGLNKFNTSKLNDPSIIDKPTKYTLNAFYLSKATKQSPVVTIGLKDVPKHSTHYLEPLIKGGPRHKKGNEVAFGNQWLAPGKAADELGLIDAYGNFKRSKIQQLLSYFSAAERSAGYSANSTNATRAKLAKMKRTYWDSKTGKMKTVTKKQLTKDPTRGYKTIGGKQYFISMGKGSGELGNQHLSKGIYQKSGVHGVDVKPILMVVKTPKYTVKLDFFGYSREWVAKNAAPIMSAAVDYAIKTAR